MLRSMAKDAFRCRGCELVVTRQRFHGISRQPHLSLLAVASYVGLGDYRRVDGTIRHPAQ